MLFTDFRSIIPSRLITNLTDLGLSQPTCHWIKDFPTNHLQTVRLGPHLYTTLTLRTCAPQGCVLSPLLYALQTHECAPNHPTNTIIKFVDCSWTYLRRRRDSLQG